MANPKDIAKYLAKLKGYADPKTSKIEDWSWKPIEEIAQRLDYPTAIPDYIQKGYGGFMQQQAARAQRGEMSPLDLIKAYGITQASIGRQGRSYNTATKAGLKLPRTDELVRPEGAFAEWLGSTPGQRYLRAAEQGEVDERALRDIQQKFAPFGKQNVLAEQLAYGATEIPKMGDVNSALLADRDRFRTWASSLNGIDTAKPGFIGSLLGRGDVPTLDARQVILQANTPPVSFSSITKRGRGTGGLEAVDRLTARQKALDLDIDPSLQPFYQHLAHHALWDKMGNAQTTHADLIKAMQGYSVGGKIAKEAFKKMFTPGYYHASPNPRIKAFDPFHEPNPIDGQSTPRGATFLTQDPNFAESYLRTNAKGDFAPGSTMYPVSVNLGKHFDPHTSPEAQALIQEFVKANPSVKPGSFTEKWHNWTAMENPAFNKLLRDQGYDTFAVTEGGVKNIGVLNPKNIRGKFAKFNSEDAESADFMKAEGGLAHLAAGGKTPAWQRKEGKNPEGGLNAAGRASYNRETGGNLKAPQPEGGPRRDSFCARMKGMKKKLTSAETANDPDSRINKSLRKWKC